MKVNIASCVPAFMWIISFNLSNILVRLILFYLLFTDKDAEA